MALFQTYMCVTKHIEYIAAILLLDLCFCTDTTAAAVIKDTSGIATGVAPSAEASTPAAPDNHMTPLNVFFVIAGAIGLLSGSIWVSLCWYFPFLLLETKYNIKRGWTVTKQWWRHVSFWVNEGRKAWRLKEARAAEREGGGRGMQLDGVGA